MPRLRLLGGALVEKAPGVPHAISSRRHPVAVLALLSTARSLSLARSRLAGLLWPEVPESTARNRLGSCVYEIRQALGSDALLSVGSDLRLDRDVVACDVIEFGAAFEAGEHELAVELYAGPFLEGFSLDVSAEFEHHVDRERDRLARDYREALEWLASRAEQAGDPATAATWWLKRAADSMHDSRVVSRLMKSLAAAGNRAEALRVAASHQRLLEQEFGTAPDPAFQRLVGRLRSAGTGPVDRRATGASALGDDPANRSIAVLPFRDLAGPADAAPFALGLHDDLLTELSRIPGLTVISRTSVRRYRDTDRPIGDIAGELGVTTVLQGSVRIDDARLRLNVQLVDARTEANRWVERYDRELSTASILDIQTELASRIAATLRGELEPPADRRRGSASTMYDIEAWRLCIQGRALLDQRTQREMFRAIDYFQRAIGRASDYALAWSGLADALSLLEFYDYPAPPSAPDPLDAARRAVKLAQSSGAAHASLGTILAIRQDGSAALRELETAVSLAPGSAEPYAWLAWVHLLRGHADLAIAPARRAVELDPLAPALRAYLAETWLALGNMREALGEARRGRRIRPEYGLTHFVEGLVLHHLGRNAEAAAALQAALELVPPEGTPKHAEVHALLALVEIASGSPALARQRLGPIRDAAHAMAEGLVLAALDETEAAFVAFGRVRDWRSFSTENFRYFFPDVLGPLRQDERYRRILRDIDSRWGTTDPDS